MRVTAITKTTAKRTPELLDWDTEFWGIRMGRVYDASMTQWAVENAVGMVCLLIDADRPEEVQEAERRGFIFTDVRVTLECEATTSMGGQWVRPHRPEDIEALVRIARTSHRITRFYADPKLDDSVCDDLYERWIRNSCSGWASQVLVADLGRGPVGYITLHGEGEHSSIGLVAVEESQRGQGLGLQLCHSAIGWAKESKHPKMSVVTQGRNTDALRTFQRAGFLHRSTELWYHHWIES